MTDNNGGTRQLTENLIVQTGSPVVLIGPNGSGKTRLGHEIAQQKDADIIGALRNIQISGSIPMQRIERAEQQLERQIRNRRQQYWTMSNEIDHLFAKLLAEDAEAARNFRDRYVVRGDGEPKQTTLMKLGGLWEDLFPGRTIDFSDYAPVVRNELAAETAEYQATRMSDGERVALYLAARILTAESPLIIVDEPEVHFHSRLAVRFWDLMEDVQCESQFVYITHDLPFALSRNNAQYVVVRAGRDPELVPVQEDVTREVAEPLLGAATLSLYAKRIVFCEGGRGRSLDYSLYSAWFSDRDSEVVPVGGCESVVQCTESFGREELISGLSAIGIIDRDFWPDEYLERLPSTVHGLPVHEVEGLFCLPGVFRVIAQLSMENEAADEAYESFLANARRHTEGGLLANVVSERFRRRCELEFQRLLNSIPMEPELDDLEDVHTAAVKVESWELDPRAIFQEERRTVTEAHDSDVKALLRIFPGKVMLGAAARVLGMTPERYSDVVITALNDPDDSPFSEGIEDSLESALPARQVS